MTADGHHQTEGQHDDSGPWWWGIGPLGAVGLIVSGIAVALWSAFGLPGSSDTPALDLYGAGKVIAIGMVVGGTALLGNLRRRATRTGGAEEPEGR
ncbi:hypothetical protein [Streptomyces sp. RKCA744]|uniref:hypothetical protein n=1 Tax=Streptomyces sp. RKCA744 TaxID=2959340 RepID=UPI00209D6713|nr:hypothetical protein [Streptomyces sp. RKCA744]MCO8303669.1 hypothetical protein [Streptomyces sp. RKCA744]